MKKALKIFFYLSFSFFILICVGSSLFLVRIFSDKESISFDYLKLHSPTTFSKIQIYDSNNDLINISPTYYSTIDEINQQTIDAFISIEDKNFYNHNGINPKRIIKAGLNNLISGSFKEGASTISQQLIKNTHLSSDKTIERKIKEIIITKKMEQELTKDEIMECYLNVIYFGNGAHGIYEASDNYFGKHPSELTLSESALLAGIIKAPSKYSPYKNPVLAKERRNLVLKVMYEDEKISKKEFESASNAEIYLKDQTTEKLSNNKNLNLYEKMAIKEACEILNLDTKNLKNFKIYTYKQPQTSTFLQNILEDDDYNPKNIYGNTTSNIGIIIDNKTGAIETLCGKSEYELSLIDRQPGSAIKPILVYSPAIEEGIISPISPILDEEINIDGYSPNNVGGFHGYVSVRESVCKSLNIPAIKILEKVGLKNGKKFAENTGIKFSNQDNNYAIALGGFTQGINLKDLTTSYLPFSNNGNFINSTFIREIRNENDIVVYKHNIQPKQIMGSDTAYLMTDMLMSGVKEGTSKRLNTLPFQVAGKTGTVAVPDTNYNNDAISIAYTSDKTMGVWLGNYSMEKEYQLESTNNGGTFATSIIRDTFSNLYKNSKPNDFQKPDNVKNIKLDRLCLEDNLVVLANDHTPERFIVEELFSTRYLPHKVSSNFQDYEIEDLSIKNSKNTISISFNCEDYIDYIICAYSDNEEIVLDRISNRNESFSNNYKLDKIDNIISIYVKYKYDFDKNYKISKKFKIQNWEKNNEYDDLIISDFSSIWI